MRESRREQSTEAQEVELSASGAVRVFKHDRGESSRVADCPQWLACLDYRRATLAIRKVDRLVGSEVVAIQTMVSMGEFSARTVLPELERFVAETPADAKHADIRAYAEAGAKVLRKNKPAPAAVPVVAKP